MSYLTQRWLDPRLLILLLGIAAATYLTLHLASSCKRGEPRPTAFAGRWQIVGIDGEPRGTATLASDGSVDTKDDYTGVWTADDSSVHLVMWKKRSDEPRGLFEATPDVQSLSIKRFPGGQVALSGDHVILQRWSGESS